MPVEQFSLPAGTFGFLRTLAGFTETKIDDLLVDLLEAVTTDPTLSDWFAGRVAAGATTELAPDGTLSFVSDEPPAEISQALFDRGIFKGAKDAAEVAGKLKDLLPLLLKLAEFAKLFIK
jgi:hypothetical protein